MIYSSEDLSVGLVGNPVDGICGYSPMAVKTSEGKTKYGASEIMTNVLMYAANGGPATGQAADRPADPAQPSTQPAPIPGVKKTGK